MAPYCVLGAPVVPYCVLGTPVVPYCVLGAPAAPYCVLVRPQLLSLPGRSCAAGPAFSLPSSLLRIVLLSSHCPVCAQGTPTECSWGSGMAGSSPQPDFVPSFAAWELWCPAWGKSQRGGRIPVPEAEGQTLGQHQAQPRGSSVAGRRAPVWTGVAAGGKLGGQRVHWTYTSFDLLRCYLPGT